MSGEERLNEFLAAMDSWLGSKSLPLVDENPQIKMILNMNATEIRELSNDECSAYAYELYAYSEYVEGVRTKEKIVLDWADASIWYIISTVMQNYGTQYTKWQEKYYAAIKENPTASDILRIKNHAECRVTTLDGKSARIQKMADILTNLSRRR
tara:strand:+ start:459 stop:920 length:462 start_codon:yes stop_codon:yes gene_type:complete